MFEILRTDFFQKLNCTEQDVIAALEVHDPKNQYRIAYNLILDSKTNRHIGNSPFNQLPSVLEYRVTSVLTHYNTRLVEMVLLCLKRRITEIISFLSKVCRCLPQITYGVLGFNGTCHLQMVAKCVCLSWTNWSALTIFL